MQPRAVPESGGNTMQGAHSNPSMTIGHMGLSQEVLCYLKG